MPKNIQGLRQRLPSLPTKFESQEILSYLSVLNRVLQTYFDESELVLADRNLDGSNILQSLAAGFTINPDAFFIDVSSTTAVTSSTTTAIKNGRARQRIVICNRGTSNITIKQDANTKLNASADVAITPDGALTLRWGGSYWFELGRSLP